MSRGITAGFIAQASASLNRPALFFEAAFVTQTLRMWSGINDISWNSQTWLGNGYLGVFTGGNEITEVQATGIEINFSGVPQTLVSLILQEVKLGAKASLYFGFLDSAGAVIADPYPMFVGKADSARITEAGETANITLSYETVLIDLERAREFRYTKENQRIFFPNDLGFDYVASLQSWTGFWGTQQKKLNKKK